MYSLFTPHSVLAAFIAGILFFLVAPHLSLVSRTAGLAARLAAAVLVLRVGGVFFGRFLMGLPLPIDPFALVHLVSGVGFWACLAWAVLALIESAPKKELR